MSKTLLPLLVFSLIIGSLHAQRSAQITKVVGRPTIDGVLDEPLWDGLDELNHFINQWPVDSGLAKSQTVVKMAFDDAFLYIGIQCFEQNNAHVIRTLKRDKPDEHFGSDGIGVVLDPVNEKSSGFFFGVNAGGAQMEGLIRIRGSNTIIDENWDNKWFSKTTIADSVWYVEMAIPFRTLRYDPNNQVWGLNIVRNDMKNNVYSSWNQVPVNFNTIDLGYTGLLHWSARPPSIKNGSVNLLPYASSSLSKDFEAMEALKTTHNVGVDAKVAITPSLNLDLTINPDFSTVDVDIQQTNLTRFSLFFPERRGFFLENSDLFTSFGIRSINPFFSRRIGLVGGQTVPIIYGMRVTGNVSDKSRIGFLNVRTASKEGINAQNYTVGSYQFRVGQRSSFNALFVDRRKIGRDENSLQNSYNSIAAANFKLLTPDGKWSAEVGYNKSFNPGDLEHEGTLSASARYATKKLFSRFSVHSVGQNYLTDVGFVPRLVNYDAENDTTVRIGFTQFGYSLFYDSYPESEKINLHGPRFSSNVRTDENGQLVATFAGLFYYLNFKNQNEFEISYFHEYDNLPFSSFIVGDVPFPKDDFINQSIGFFFRTDPRKKVSLFTSGRIGSFYNGTRKNLVNRVNYRVQPWGNFGLSYEINDIQLPSPLESSTLHLLGPVAEISFSNAMFWTTFVQLNTQWENLNINSRFQWRFKPMSDIFLVYSDNYLPESLTAKNRSLVIKVTYWI